MAGYVKVLTENAQKVYYISQIFANYPKSQLKVLNFEAFGYRLIT